MTKQEILDTVNRIERRESERRVLALRAVPERRQMNRRVTVETAERMDAGRDHVRQVRSVQAVIEQIKGSALRVPMVPNTLAVADFRPAPIVDAGGFGDVWGDAR
jgi:hypothetical protein